MDSGSLIKLIEADGWSLDRTKGSHHVFTHNIRKGIVVIPHPKKDLPKGTVNSILKQAGLKQSRFLFVFCNYILEFLNPAKMLSQKNKIMVIKVKIEKAEDGTYWGASQNIPGVVSAYGNTLDELKENLKEAIGLYIETAKEHENEIYEKLSKGFDLELDIKLYETIRL